VEPLLWNGIRYRWRRTAHRLARLGTGFVAGEHELTLKIGAFPPDTADYTAWFVRLPEVAGVVAVRGVAAKLQVSGVIGHTARARAVVRLPAPALLRPDQAHGVALLGGFGVRSAGNRSGWHFGRLGIGLGPLRRTPEGLEFDVDVVLRPSEAPEIFHFGNLGWSYDRPCVYDVEVDWVVVVGEPEALPIEPRRWEVTVPRGLEEERTEQLRVGCPPGVRPERHAVAGLRGFDVEVDALARQRRRSRILRYYTGRNTREFGLWIEADHDPQTGVTLLKPGVAFSNRAALGWTLPLAVTLLMVAVAVAGYLVGGVTGGLLIGLAVAMASFGLAWPGGPLALPSVPWSLRAAVDCSLIYLPEGAEATTGTVRAVHEAHDDPFGSAAPLGLPDQP